VARTSTFALNNATLPFIVQLAQKGISKAVKENKNLANGVNIKAGKLLHEVVATALDGKL
jgi:alanine dehydrogenase